MDLSALIFVALAVAWAVYLIPKALKHHDDVARSRTVDRFSHSMRVLARREPTSPRSARLVVTPGRPAATAIPVAEPAAVTPPTRDQVRARRQAAARAAKRRLRVLSVIAAAIVVTVALAIGAVIAWPYVAIPVALLVMWLVACRLMVRRERAAVPSTRLPLVDAEGDADGPVTDEISAVTDEPAEVVVERDPGSWDPVPVTLPTYVTKEQATRRTVRTIDLDSTGVWTSGHTESDSVIAREADEAERAAKASRKADEQRRASGS